MKHISGQTKAWCTKAQLRNTVIPLLSPRGAYLFQAHLKWGGGGLFNFELTRVSVLHKELEYKVEKLKYKKF